MSVTKKRRISDDAVSRAWASADSAARAASEGHGLSRVAEELLDRLGITELSAKSGHELVQDNVARSLTQKFNKCDPELQNAISQELILRLSQMSVNDDVNTSQHAGAVIWLANMAGKAIDGLRQGASAEEAIRLAAYMPITGKVPGGGLRNRILAHPDCPADVLEHACLEWELAEARLASRHPRCTEEGKVVAALRC